MAETAASQTGAMSGDRVKRTLVVVDSDGSHLYYTSMMLQRLEYNIHSSKTAEDALEIVDAAPPALVLTEISLSGMDGLELLRKVKRNPRTNAIPVIVLTSSRDPLVKEACLAEGCKAYLQKPVDPDVLYAAIQKATESVPRKYIRLNTCLNVIVGDDPAEAPVIGDYITALSENGIYISTAKPRPVGLQVPITILLKTAKIKVEGMVLYSFKQGEGPLRTPGMGVKFVRIKDEDQALIRSFIKQEITKGILTAGQIGGAAL